MAWRKTHILRIPRRYLLLAGESLLLGFLILGVDVRRNHPVWEVNAPAAISFHDLRLIIHALGGEYGIEGYCLLWNKTHCTYIWYGSDSLSIPFHIYTVIACANCFLFTGVFLVIGFIKRKRPAAP